MPSIDQSTAPPVGRLGLSGKLLILTILFVMIAQVLIYVPSIANFRRGWLNDKISTAYTAALVFQAAPHAADGEDEVSDVLAKQILESIGARTVAMKMGERRRLLASSDSPPMIDQDIDMRDLPMYRSIVDAFETLFSTDNDVMRVVGPAPMGGEFIEIVLDEKPLRQRMRAYSVNVLLLSLLISAITASLVYLALHLLFVRPLRRLTANMVAFSAQPENPVSIITPSQRGDEIGTAERQLARMQVDLASMLHQKNHLAALGLAVSKINHDLRNLLTTAQLFSDRISSLPDARVRQFAPKLMHALERAIDFCQSTLSYGRVQEAPPERRMVALEPLVEEVRETVGLESHSAIRWIDEIEAGLMVDADPNQLFRVLVNLARNAVQALETRRATGTAREGDRDEVRVIGRRAASVVTIEVADTGPGISAQARSHLFEAFQSSDRAGGSGLGLAIAAELVRAHGGDIQLVDTVVGATFRLTIPERPAET
jgi:signal transduction histidine kinase